MITDLNRFLIALGGKLDLAKEDVRDTAYDILDYQYTNGYCQGLLDMQKLAQDIYNGRNGY